jgi:hypothetical protein
LLGKEPRTIIIISHQAIVAEGDEVEAAATEGITRVPEGFCAATLDGSTSLDIL